MRFIPDAPVHVSTTKAEFDRKGDGYQAVDSQHQPVGKPVDAIPLAIGDHASLSYSPEDSCDLIAVVKDGQRGLLANSFFYNMSSGKAQTAEEFTPAQDQIVPLQIQPAQPRP